ncbi:MAG: ABC transporter permease, partial [Minisyncoccales bacterium]
TTLLRHRHNINDEEKDDFSVRSMTQMLNILKGVTGAIQAFLILVVAISLIVGGIGITNVILSSVSNRIREIGLRKAVGAKNRDILIQFLIESGLLSFLGGVIGIILGVSFGHLISYSIRYFTGFEWYFVISPWQIIGAVIISILVGVLAGIYPAYKASKLDPIDALHYE